MPFERVRVQREIWVDNCLPVTGILSAVGVSRAVPMSDLSAKDKGERQSGAPADKTGLNTPEGQQVRNASGDQLEAIKAANPNASDGSVKNWALMTKAEKFAHVEKAGQDRSIELVDTEPSGREIVVAARQMVVEVEAKGKAATTLQELGEVDSRPIKDYGFEVEQHGQDKVIRTGLEYQAGPQPEVTEQNLFERIGALPLEQQAQVIGAAIKAYNGELTHQQFRIGVGAITGLGDGVVGLAQSAESLGSSIIGVVQFSRDVMTNDPAAEDAAGKVGESLGKLMVGGIHVFAAADAYLGSLGAATTVGDYGKGLRDVAWLGEQINQRWEAMSPEEKTRLATKLTVENLGGLAVGFGADRLAKSVKITEALEALGTEASAMGSGVREKASKLISRMTDELMPQPMGMTTDGQRIVIPRQAQDNYHAMSKADDLGGVNKPKDVNSGNVEKPSEVSSSREIKDVENEPKQGSLTNVQARDWYNAKIDEIDAIEGTMRKAGNSAEEIFEATTKLRNEAKIRARELMKDRELREKLEKDNPIKPSEEILAKYGGDYEKAIAASKRTNADVNRRIEELRKEKEG